MLASSNHVVGMYEAEHAPALYEEDHGLLLDNKTPIRTTALRKHSSKRQGGTTSRTTSTRRRCTHSASEVSAI
jgi:hypothetical protein